MSSREAIKTILYILATLALVVGAVWWLGGCEDRGIKDLPSRPDPVPPSENITALVWDAAMPGTVSVDSQSAATPQPIEGYEIGISPYEEAFDRKFPPVRYELQLMDVGLPGGFKPPGAPVEYDIELPQGGWWVGVRAYDWRYVLRTGPTRMEGLSNWAGPLYFTSGRDIEVPIEEGP